MKLFYSLLALCILFTGELSAQNINWAFNTGGALTNTNDVEESGVFVLNDGSGNLINIGNFKGTSDLDPSASSVVNLTSTSADQVSTYMAKYDTNKNLLWAKKIDNLSAYALQDARADKSGNFYIAGFVSQSVNFNTSGGSTIFPYSSSDQTTDYFIAKYNTSGDLIWVYNFVGVSKITTDDFNNFYVYGVLSGATDVDVTAGVHIVSPANAAANYFAKYDVNLNVLLVQKIECGTASVQGYASVDAIATDNTNIYLSGDYYGTVDFDPSPTATANIAVTPTGVPHSDPYFAKYDGTTGAMAWAKSITCNGENAFIHNNVDASGNFYIMGFTNSTTMDFDPSSGVVTGTGSGGSDSYLAKYTTNGDLVWVNYFKGISDFSFIVSPQHVYLHAMAGPTLNLNPSGAQPFYINANNNFIGAYNLNDGTLDWASGIGGANQVTLSPNLLYSYGGHSITVDAQENVYATGCYYPVPGNTVSDFDPTPNVYQLTLKGDRTDSYLVKYSPLKLDFTTDKSAYCQSETMTINFNPFGYYPTGNQYTFLLSDANGSFAAPVTLSTQTTSVAGTFTYLIPVGTPAGTGYKIRMTASNPSTVPVVEKSIVINAIPITPVISGALSVCGNAQSKTYSITNHAGSTYVWTAPANAAISGSNSNQQVVLNFSGYVTTGNVSVVETNTLGCGSAQASLSIAPLAVPVAPTISGSASVCGNAGGKVYAVTNTAGSTYNWNFPATATNSGILNSNSITLDFIGFTTTGTISVAETNSAGCTGLAGNFTVSPLVVPVTSSITGSAAVCANATSQSYTVTSTSGSTYAWSVAGSGTVSSGQGGNTATINYSAFSGGSIVVVETNTSNCKGEPVSLLITGLATPVTSAISGAASLCGNAVLAPYSVTAHAGNTYAWSFPSHISIDAGAGTNAVTVTCSTFVTGANATVIETNTSSGCSGLPVSLFINPLAVPVNTITGAASICGNAKGVTYSVPATTGSVYSWTPVPGTTVIGASNQHAIQFDCTDFNTGFTLKVQETTSAGCTGPDATLNLIPLLVPPANPILGSLVNCTPGTSLMFICGQLGPGSTYQWMLPSNAAAETATTQTTLGMHFNNSAGGDLKMTEKLNLSGCTYENILSIEAAPVPVITGPAVVCGQPVAAYTFSTAQLSNATYNWVYNSLMSPQGPATGSSIDLKFNNFTYAYPLTVNVTYKGCLRSATFTVSPKTSPDLPVIQGPAFTCNSANNAVVPYQLNHSNSGYHYAWSIPPNMFVTGNDLSASAISLNLSNIASLRSAGIISVSEIDNTDQCVVAQVSKTITGYAPVIRLSSGRLAVCDLSKNYAFSVSSLSPGSTYNWVGVQNTTVVSGNGTNTANLHFNTAVAISQFSVSETNALGCPAGPFGFDVRYNGSQYGMPNQVVSCAGSSFMISIARSFEPNINKMEINLTYNSSYASLATSPTYYLDGISSSDGTAVQVSITESIPGNLKVVFSAHAGASLIYLYGNLIYLRFDINHTNMLVGNVNTFASSSILEYYLDGSVESCNTVSATVTKVATAGALNGTLVYSDTGLRLGYNSAQPSQYLVTNISGTSDCSGLSSPIVPNLNGNFTYNLTNGDNLNIKRDIAPATDVTKYINADDALKVFKIIDALDLSDKKNTPVTMCSLLAADVNRDGKITSDDHDQIVLRSAKKIESFHLQGNLLTETPDWNFIDETTISNTAAYLNAQNQYMIASTKSPGIIFDVTQTLPIIPSCLPIHHTINGSCAEAPPETYHGILMGDVELPSPYKGTAGYFDNAAGSQMRTQEVTENNATVIYDLSAAVQLPGNKVRFPLYFFAADTAQALDVQLDYDQTKIRIDTVENTTEEINKDFIFAYNDANHDVLIISGFGKQPLLSNTTLLNVTATLLDGNISKSMLGDFGITLINGNPAQGQIVEATATAIVESEAFKNVRLFPNPTTGQLQLTGLENVSSSVQIVNTLGVAVTGEHVNATSMDVSNLAAGLYYVKISVDGSDKMIRFIKL
ncbi:MAG: large protein [Chitinophagaceae bacterium]|nr:large protein [Chitinophagaceae bacterium]